MIAQLIPVDVSSNLQLGEFFKITELSSSIGGALSIALILAGSFFMLLLGWSALRWLTAGGDKSQAESAKQRMTNAFIGIILLIATWAIYLVVVYVLGLPVNLIGMDGGGGSPTIPTTSEPSPLGGCGYSCTISSVCNPPLTCNVLANECRNPSCYNDPTCTCSTSTSAPTPIPTSPPVSTPIPTSPPVSTPIPTSVSDCSPPCNMGWFCSLGIQCCQCVYGNNAGAFGPVTCCDPPGGTLGCSTYNVNGCNPIPNTPIPTAVSTPISVCGNGITEIGEQCDDGNTNTSDGCINCRLAYCGDGYIRSEIEQCDSFNLGGLTCTNFGYDNGSLTCNASCNYDFSQCCTGDGSCLMSPGYCCTNNFYNDLTCSTTNTRCGSMPGTCGFFCTSNAECNASQGYICNLSTNECRHQSCTSDPTCQCRIIEFNFASNTSCSQRCQDSYLTCTAVSTSPDGLSNLGMKRTKILGICSNTTSSCSDPISNIYQGYCPLPWGLGTADVEWTFCVCENL